MNRPIIQKYEHFRSKKLTDSARDQYCQNCGSMGTTVAAHSNLSAHGKAGAMKASDEFTAFLCGPCHFWYDAGRGERIADPSHMWEPEERQEMWHAAHDKTLHELFKQGKIVVV